MGSNHGEVLPPHLRPVALGVPSLHASLQVLYMKSRYLLQQEASDSSEILKSGNSLHFTLQFIGLVVKPK